MSRGESFNAGAGRTPTPEGWVRVRANTVYGTGSPSLVAIPREHVLQDSHEGSEDHVLGYVTDHQGGRGGQDRAFTLHTVNGPRVVSVKKRAWLFMHHGQARGAAE